MKPTSQLTDAERRARTFRHLAAWAALVEAWEAWKSTGSWPALPGPVWDDVGKHCLLEGVEDHFGGLLHRRFVKGLHNARTGWLRKKQAELEAEGKGAQAAVAVAPPVVEPRPGSAASAQRWEAWDHVLRLLLTPGQSGAAARLVDRVNYVRQDLSELEPEQVASRLDEGLRWLAAHAAKQAWHELNPGTEKPVVHLDEPGADGRSPHETLADPFADGDFLVRDALNLGRRFGEELWKVMNDPDLAPKLSFCLGPRHTVALGLAWFGLSLDVDKYGGTVPFGKSVVFAARDEAACGIPELAKQAFPREDATSLHHISLGARRVLEWRSALQISAEPQWAALFQELSRQHPEIIPNPAAA